MISRWTRVRKSQTRDKSADSSSPDSVKIERRPAHALLYLRGQPRNYECPDIQRTRAQEIQMSANNGGLKNDLKKDGYSQEEKYFYELNKELIETRRKKLDFSRNEKRIKE